ncbi:MAG: flagellar FliJ family protein [Armatimonadota bacterium]|nr:flagellar FliJ family protein [Armatimonadota bacterium]MDR7435760.1 flagellar FliJ family protein [Armatimonadota bacterium]
MKRFQFPLQTLLDVRSRREELCAQRLAEAQRLVREQERLVQELRTIFAEGRLALRRALEEGAGVEEILLHLEHIQRLEVHLARAEACLLELKAKEEETRKEFLEARRARRVVERLRERRWASYLQEVHREEGKFLDEVAIAAKNRELEG